MARETAAQREARLAEEKVQKELLRQDFLAVLPDRMLRLACRAQTLGLQVTMRLLDGNPTLEFPEAYGESQLSYSSEEWELAGVEDWLDSVEHAKLERDRRFKLAQDAMTKLTVEELSALREFQHLK